MVKTFAHFDDLIEFEETELPDFLDHGEIIVEFDDQEGLELEEIENVVIDEAMHDLTEELTLELPNSLILKLRNHGLLPIWFPCIYHTAHLAIKDFWKPILELVVKSTLLYRKSKNL